MRLALGSWSTGIAGMICMLLPASLFAAQFSSTNNLVVVRLGDGSAFNSGAARPIFLDEYNVGGASASLAQSVAIPSSGVSSVTLPDSLSHDGLLNRSVDGHYLVLAGYRAAAGSGDPTVTSSVDVPRVIVRVSAAGAVDATTALADSYDKTVVRAVATDDGSRFWVAGDNADANPDTATTGGLRYVAALGNTTTVNLSQVQNFSPPPTPDNVRSVAIVDGQLYESSGSSSSIGKAVFRVGMGLPTSDPQLLTTLTTDGASTNAFYFADLSPAIAGIDTLYTSASAQGIGLHKYSKSCVGDNCVWSAKGVIALPGVEAMTASVSGSNVTLYATDGSTVFRLADSTGYNANIVGAFSSILTAGANESFRGLAFAPSAAATPGDYNHDDKVDAADYTVWRDTIGATGAGLAADGDGNQHVDAADYTFWKTHFGDPAGSGSLSGPLAVPEPSAIAPIAICLASALAVLTRTEFPRRVSRATLPEFEQC